MISRLEEFRSFISRHPKIHDDIINRNRTWQDFYEDWVILGENHPQWQKYRGANGNRQNINPNFNQNQSYNQYGPQNQSFNQYGQQDQNYDQPYGNGYEQDSNSYYDQDNTNQSYYETTPTKNKSGRQDFLNTESIKNIVGYLKKIDPDTISRTLNTVSKVLQITQGFGGAGRGVNTNFNSWWD